MVDFAPGARKDSAVKVRSPGESLQAEPWAFIGVALIAGLAAGLLLRHASLRRMLRFYLTIRSIL
jgi:hypothetical protein